MITVGPYTLTYAEYREGQMGLHHHLVRGRSRWSIASEVTVGILAGGLLTLLSGFADVPVALPAAYLLGLLVGVGLMCAAFSLQQKRAFRRYVSAQQGMAPWTVTMDDPGLVAQSEVGENRFPWSAVTHTARGAATVTLILHAAPFVLPLRAFDDPGEAPDWIGAQVS
ncbi:MAG: hypothetical protein ACU0DW_16175 [Shimia sp.]